MLRLVSRVWIRLRRNFPYSFSVQLALLGTFEATSGRSCASFTLDRDISTVYTIKLHDLWSGYKSNLFLSDGDVCVPIIAFYQIGLIHPIARPEVPR